MRAQRTLGIRSSLDDPDDATISRVILPVGAAEAAQVAPCAST